MRLWTQDEMRKDFHAQFSERKEHRIVLDQTGSSGSQIIDRTTGERFAVEQDHKRGVFRFFAVIPADTE